jgi:hypothetical protein
MEHQVQRRVKNPFARLLAPYNYCIGKEVRGYGVWGGADGGRVVRQKNRWFEKTEVQIDHTQNRVR